MTNHDNVNKPSHYTEGRAFEVIEVLEDWCGRAPDPVLGGLQWNSLKYQGRLWDKVNPLEDAKKSRWYLNRLIDKLEAKQAVPFAVTYEDVLEEVTAAAAAGQQLLSEYGISDVDDQSLDYWENDSSHVICQQVSDSYADDSEDLKNLERWAEGAAEWDFESDSLWDPSLGPAELSQKEINMILRNRDVSDSNPDEIVKVIEKRGFLLGVKANGNTCVLNDRGSCE